MTVPYRIIVGVMISLFMSSGVFAQDGKAVAKAILKYDQLTKDQQSIVTQKLSRKAWREFSAEERMTIQKACAKRSGKTLGKDQRGRLKLVKDEGEKLILKYAGNYLNSLPPEQVPAHPAAADIYGSIPPNAPRITRVVEVDPAVVRWQSTGLYAAPGEVVEFIFPEEWVGKGLAVQLSGHRDRIPTTKSLRRTPASPARSFPVMSRVVKAAGTYGGALYIDFGNGARPGKPFQVKIKNALAAPYFVLGKTTVAEWKKMQRNAPAPYAEFVSDRVAFSFPAKWIRDLDDPTELLEYWDHVVALHDELGGMANTRLGPERVNVDVQISVGLFHAGYPAQGPQNKCHGMVELEKLKMSGNWGWFHELGHEAQRRPDKAWSWNNPYTFDGSVETTVNLFTSHAMDQMGIKQRGGWTWTATAEEVEQRAHKALAKKKPFAELGAGEKLAMYLQLRDQFGWEPIQKVLASYSTDQDTRPKTLPKGNQAKRDAFFVRISNATQRNLAPFMKDLWSIDLSPEAIAQVKDLPVWMPAGF